MPFPNKQNMVPDVHYLPSKAKLNLESQDFFQQTIILFLFDCIQCQNRGLQNLSLKMRYFMNHTLTYVDLQSRTVRFSSSRTLTSKCLAKMTSEHQTYILLLCTRVVLHPTCNPAFPCTGQTRKYLSGMQELLVRRLFDSILISYMSEVS